MASTSLRRVSRLPGLRHLRPYWRSFYFRLRNLMVLPASLPGLIRNPQQRALFRETRAFIRALPEKLQEPLPIAIKRLDGAVTAERPSPQTEKVTRNLADLAVLLYRRSPLGLCLRRSLTRYYFLRREGLPLQVHFGARFVDGKPDREITGHAWLTLDDKPYYEPGKNWRGFTVMLTFPQPNKASVETTNDNQQ
jgi:Transglutaminase-like superfamily